MIINKLRTTRHLALIVAVMSAMLGILLSLGVSALNEMLSIQQDQSVSTQTKALIADSSAFLKIEEVDLTKGFADTVEFVTEKRTEVVPFDVIDCPVQTIPKGTRQVTQNGIDGKAERTYIVKYVNGEKEQEVLYSEKAIEKPVEEIANVGVGGVVTGKDGKSYNFSYYKKMEATAYTYVPGKTTMTTATGRRLQKGIIAVDPKVIPLHTKLFVTGDIEYGYGEAEDTGGVIKGDIVDLAYMSYDECIQFGRRQVTVYILE